MDEVGMYRAVRMDSLVSNGLFLHTARDWLTNDGNLEERVTSWVCALVSTGYFP